MKSSWTRALFAVFYAFLAAGFIGAWIAGHLGRWDIPAAGFCAAFAVVVVTDLTVPRHKMTNSALVLVIGAVIAWRLLEPSHYPESYRQRAYQATHVPLIVTWAGGILGLAAVAARRLRRHEFKR